MKPIFTLLVLVYTLSIYAQYPQLEWAGSLGTNLKDQAVDIEVDQNGDVYVLGNFSSALWANSQPIASSIDLDMGVGTQSDSTRGFDDIFLLKLDQFGSLIWSRTWGSVSIDKGLSVQVGESGSIYLLGEFGDTIDFDPGSGVTAVSTSLGNSFILKLNPLGDFLWVKTFGDDPSGMGMSESIEMVLDTDENIYTTGHIFNATIDFNPGVGTYFQTAVGDVIEYYVQKLDSAGNFVWANISQATFGKFPSGIDIDANNNPVVVGQSQSDPFQINGPYPFQQIFVDRLDNLGNLVWNYTSSNNYVNYASDVRFDQEGDIYTCGLYSGVVDFDPGIDSSIQTAIASSGDVFIFKLDEAGSFRWVNTYGGSVQGARNVAMAIDLDSDKNVYMTGNIVDTVDFDPSADSAILVNANMLLKLDSVGDFVWVVENQFGNAVKVNLQNDIYLVGGFDSISNIDFDPNIGVYNLSNAGDGDAFVQKLSQCANKTHQDVVACGSFYWTATDSVYLSSTTSQFTLINQSGCDSIVSLILEVENFIADATVQLQGTELVATAPNANYQWLDCSNGYAPIAGETNQSYMPSINGDYAVAVTQGSCTDTSDCLSSSLEVNEYNIGSLQLYPNPTASFFDVVLENNELVTAVHIYSVSGQLVFKLNNVSTNIQRVNADLVNGLYMIEVLSDGQKYYKKIIKY